jgi:hypothetical protein
VYVRVQSNYLPIQTAIAYVIVVQQLTVKSIPTMGLAITDYQECDDDTDGFTEFNLSSKDLEVLGNTNFLLVIL